MDIYFFFPNIYADDLHLGARIDWVAGQFAYFATVFFRRRVVQDFTDRTTQWATAIACPPHRPHYAMGYGNCLPT